MSEIDSLFVGDNVEIVEKSPDEIGGYPVTFDVRDDRFASVRTKSEYINSSDLFKLSQFVTEFEEHIRAHQDNIKFAVASIVINDDKPIKIRRVKMD
jgi:hypothetical protein